MNNNNNDNNVLMVIFWGLSRPWPVFTVHHGNVRRKVCMFAITKGDTKLAAGESKISIVPSFPYGPGSISLAWGTFVSKLKPVTSRESRGMGAKLCHD